MGAAMAYFLVNSAAVAAAFALANRRPVFEVWHDNFLWSITSYVGGGGRRDRRRSVAADRAMGSEPRPSASVPDVPHLPHLNRIADEQRRVAEWTQLHRESTEVLARAISGQGRRGERTSSACSTRGQPRAPPRVVGA